MFYRLPIYAQNNPKEPEAEITVALAGILIIDEARFEGQLAGMEKVGSVVTMSNGVQFLSPRSREELTDDIAGPRPTSSAYREPRLYDRTDN